MTYIEKAQQLVQQGLPEQETNKFLNHISAKLPSVTTIDMEHMFASAGAERLDAQIAIERWQESDSDDE